MTSGRRRSLVVIALALVVWATVAFVTGGFSGTLLGVKIASRNPIRPLGVALVLFGTFTIVFGWRQLLVDLDWIFAALHVAIAPAVLAVCASVFVFGVSFGTFTAGGADSYGYISQADLWLQRNLRVEQPFVDKIPWPNADWTFSPLGYRPAVRDHAIVPTYPPGLPILMAVAKLMGGAAGPYYIVPLFGALTVWLCYRLGAHAVSPLAGAIAAIVLAASPVFLYQLIWPMSDIPAAAFWTAVLLLSLGTGNRSALAAGLCASAAIATRPNLAPLAAIPFMFLVFTRRRWLTFALGVVPGICVVAAFNVYLYGSPLTSGYGEVGRLYVLKNGPINFVRYGTWLLMGQTPLIAVALFGLLRPSRAIGWLLATFVAAVFAAYLFYSPFDDWWYTRFLLPALPALLILTISGGTWLLGHVPKVVQVVVLPCGLILLIAYQINFAAAHGVFDIWRGEHRYVEAGEYVASATPPNAVLISMQHSGSLRYYGGRLTVRYDWLPPEWLDRALASLRAQGYRPFIVLDSWEVLEFRQRFGRDSQAGRLLAPPVAELAGGVVVYEPTAAADSPSAAASASASGDSR